MFCAACDGRRRVSKRVRLMTRLRILLLSGAAVCAAVGNGHATPTEDSKYGGSVYPTDVVEPVDARGQSLRVPEWSARTPNTKLEKALGPAAYLVSAQESPETFGAAIRRAIGRHPSFHAQAANLDESDAMRRRARSALYPQLSTQLRGDYSITRDFAAGTDNVVESLRPREQFTAGVSASQLIFDGGATIARIRSARATDDEYRNALMTRINDLAISALTAYHDVAAHQALLAFSEALIRRHEEILADVKERERLGAGSKADVTRAVARLAAAKVKHFDIQESKRIADIRYEEFFGEAPGRLARPLLDAPDIQTRSETVAVALGENPEIAAAAARADARQADLQAAKSARMPELRLSVDAVKYDVFDSSDDFDVRAGVNVNYNIFTGGARAADIAVAKSRARREKFNEEQVRQDVAREAAMAFERLDGADSRLGSLADALVAHDETRKLVLERYRLSRGDLIDVLQAENDYYEAGVAFVIGLSGRDMAGYSLMEQTGDLARLFSPQNDYDDAVYGGGVGYE